MTEPARDVLYAKFRPGLGLDVYDPEDSYGPVLWNEEIADLLVADKFLQVSGFRRTTEWVFDGDDEYIADIEFTREALPNDAGIETVRVIELTAADDATHAAMESRPWRAPEIGERNFDHGMDLG